MEKGLSGVDGPATGTEPEVSALREALVFPAPEAGRDPDYVGPSITTVAQLLYGQSDAGVLYISKDGKTLLRGEMFRMDADPFAETRAKEHPEGNPSKGPADARVTVVEFSDFECPHCRQLYMAMKILQPKYPQIAKREHIVGVVKIEVLIRDDGTVQKASAIKGHPLLVPAAEEAVRKWTYQPASINGKAVKATTEVDLTFTGND